MKSLISFGTCQPPWKTLVRTFIGHMHPRHHACDWLTSSFRVALCWTVTLALIMSSTTLATAADLSILGGMMERTETQNKSYSWQLEYLEGMSTHFAYSLSYLNEGHITLHHRDGLGGQLWARTNFFDRHLSLMVGGGPFFYSDSTWDSEGFTNDHGIGAITSLAAVWNTDSRLLFKMQGNITETKRSINTLTALVGIGYQFDAPKKQEPIDNAQPREEKTTRNELTVFAGQTSGNSAISKSAFTSSLEYRRGLTKNLDWTAAWFKGKASRLNQGNSISTQLWAVTSVFDDRLALGLGGGVYSTLDRYNVTEQSPKDLSGLTTMSVSYRFPLHWDTRVSWNRIITSKNRDADIILGGFGYRF